MAQRFEFNDPIPFSADKVMAKMLDTVFLKAWTEVQQGLNPVVTIKEKNAGRALIVIDLEEPLPKPLGTMKAIMTFDWNLKDNTMKWERSGKDAMSAKAKVFGETKVVANGANACTLVEVINVDVAIPLMGKTIEKGIADYLKKGRGTKIDYLKKNL